MQSSEYWPDFTEDELLCMIDVLEKELSRMVKAEAPSNDILTFRSMILKAKRELAKLRDEGAE